VSKGKEGESQQRVNVRQLSIGLDYGAYGSNTSDSSRQRSSKRTVRQVSGMRGSEGRFSRSLSLGRIDRLMSSAVQEAVNSEGRA